MKLLLALVLAVAPAALARAQPSFDCAGAGSAIEKTICGNDALAALDRELAASYRQLLARLDRPAAQHLIDDQQRWLLGNTRACVPKFGEVAFCLKDRYERRIARIKVLGEHGYPFVSEYEVVRDGKVGNVFYRIVASWPRFDGRPADFSTLNADFQASARARVEETVPDIDTGRKLDQQEWVYDQSFALQRPSADTVAISLSYWLRGRDGPPGLAKRVGMLVDLRTGKTLGPSDVFAPGDAWVAVLAAFVRAELERLFANNPGNKLPPSETLAALLRAPEHYHFRSDGLDLLFNTNEVASEGFGVVTVRIPSAALDPLLRADGPIRR